MAMGVRKDLIRGAWQLRQTGHLAARLPLPCPESAFGTFRELNRSEASAGKGRASPPGDKPSRLPYTVRQLYTGWSQVSGAAVSGSVTVVYRSNSGGTAFPDHQPPEDCIKSQL